MMKIATHTALAYGLLALLACLGILLVFALVLGLGWPWWVGIFLILGTLGLALAALAGHKVWLRRREQRFVHQVIAQDTAALASLRVEERRPQEELQARWKEAVSTLRTSHLKRQGNPLYVLPWYLVLGESGSGKTTAITGARLSSPFAENQRVSGISGTKNFDWWFFEQAVILDTAGRYAIPVDEGPDSREWEQFLALLGKYRKREPINGLVITVPADKLLHGDQAALREDGRNLRRRMDELMRLLGSTFPIYTLVTKCDLIQGLTHVSDSLPEEDLQQAMGLINHERTSDVAGFIARALGTIGERLRTLRLLLLHRPGKGGLDPEMLLFPEEFERLEPGLSAFMQGAFQENPYQETPLLRGVFFSSGRQEGTPYSHFLKDLGLIEAREVLPGTDKGLFLHDFFAEILPRERGLFAPTQQNLAWRRLTRNMGLMAWVALIVALCGLLSFSFVKNLSTLRIISHEFATPPVLQGELFADVGIMSRFEDAIARVETANRHWWIPRLGLDESLEVETRLKQAFCAKMNSELLRPYDERLEALITGFNSTTDDALIAAHAAHLVRRINLLSARLKGADTFEEGLPRPSYAPGMPGEHYVDELSTRFAELYLSRLLWDEDTAGLTRELNDLRLALNHLVTVKRTNLHWLAALADTDPALAPVRLQDFWGGSLSLEDEPSVPTSCTRAGRESLAAFLEELASALSDPLAISQQRLAFADWHRQRTLEAWYAFAEAFPRGSTRLKGQDEWLPAAARTGAGSGPYQGLLERLADELSPLSDGAPAWVGLVFDQEEIRKKAATLSSVAGTGALATATRSGRKLTHTLSSRIGRLTRELPPEALMASASAYQGYRQALETIAAEATGSRQAAFKLATSTFGDAGASPVQGAQEALDRLRQASAEPSDKVFWNLIRGPLDLLWEATCRQSACHLQELWSKEVLYEIQGVEDPLRASELLLGKEGYAVRFARDEAAPFLERSPSKGYTPRQLLGRGVPFEGAFLAYLTRGAVPVRPSYRVTITGLPTDANARARVKPHATHLELQCAGETLRLTNLQYPVRKTFDWSPRGGCDVVFTIEVGDLVLTRTYTGSLAFARFLDDFRTGQHRFVPGDFPQDAAALKRMGISSITARYRFEGHQKVIELLGAENMRPPETIAVCWE